MTKRPEEDRLLSRYIIVSKISFVKLFCRNLFPLIPPTPFTHLGAPNLSRLKKIRLCLVRHVHRFHQHRPVDWWGQDKSNMNTFQSNVWSSLSGLLERSSISFESNSAGQLVHDHSYFLPSVSDSSVDESEDVTDDLKFACEPPCPAKFKTRYHLDRHKSGTTCFHKLPFVCDLCGKRYRTEESKASHFSKGRCVKATES